MDELETRVAVAVGKVFKDANDGTDYTIGATQEILDAVKELGYIHLPNSQGKSITIYTSDNPEPLLTEAEWYEKYLKEHQGQDKQADA